MNDGEDLPDLRADLCALRGEILYRHLWARTPLLFSFFSMWVLLEPLEEDMNSGK